MQVRFRCEQLGNLRFQESAAPSGDQAPSAQERATAASLNAHSNPGTGAILFQTHTVP